MRIFKSEHSFDYSWDEVSTANWRKYSPWNDKSTHVVAVDTLSRSVDQATGILRTERLITCKQSAPQWVISLFGGDENSHVHEVSYVDPKAKKVTMVSTNLTWSNILSVRETVMYKPMLDNVTGTFSKDKTLFDQEARITALAGGWQKIKTKIEEASVERFGENAKKGREGFESVLAMSRMFAQERERERARM